MRSIALISVIVSAQLSFAAPAPAPAADPQFGWWSDISEGISDGIRAGVSSGIAAGFASGSVGTGIITGINNGVQTGTSAIIGNFVGTAAPGYCEQCAQVSCTGVNACQCQNIATVTCWVQSGFRCGRPTMATCNGQAPTGQSAQYPSCGKGLPACASGSTCDRTLTTGCIDYSNTGACIGVCLPSFTPYSPAQNPSTPVQNPTIPQPSAMSPTRTQCRGVGYDNDCPSNIPVCISDPAAPFGANVAGVCVSIAQQCGGTRMTACNPGKICVDDPRDSCSPGSQGCLGICV